jgi:hypothetical protein
MPQIPSELTYSWYGGCLELSIDWWNKWKDHGYSWYLSEQIRIMDVRSEDLGIGGTKGDSCL